MGGLSSDPEARAKQLANLVPGAGAAGPGNTRTVSHGAYAAIARDRLDAKMREIFDALAEDAPLREADGSLPAADVLAVELLAETLCRRENLRSHLADFGWRDQETKEPRTALLDLERRLRKEAATYLDQLGMTPRSRARLGLDLVRTVDLSRAMSEPDPAKRREMMLAAGVDPDDEDQGGDVDGDRGPETLEGEVLEP
jgi:hypothetical protein